ncbi:hypothetical protein EON63_18920 [archaeon]|nr:MAG: hypothetical protein EON63_18920 [archaeon]
MSQLEGASSGSEKALVSEDLLYAECALNSCDIQIDEEATYECRHILSLLRRKIKACFSICNDSLHHSLL